MIMTMCVMKKGYKIIRTPNLHANFQSLCILKSVRWCSSDKRITSPAEAKKKTLRKRSSFVGDEEKSSNTHNAGVSGVLSDSNNNYGNTSKSNCQHYARGKNLSSQGTTFDDFFGIQSFESAKSRFSNSYREKQQSKEVSKESLYAKFGLSHVHTDEEEKIVQTPFGHIRYDDDNQLTRPTLPSKSDKQRPECQEMSALERKIYDATPDKFLHKNRLHSRVKKKTSLSQFVVPSPKISKTCDDLNYIDQQYFSIDEETSEKTSNQNEICLPQSHHHRAINDSNKRATLETSVSESDGRVQRSTSLLKNESEHLEQNENYPLYSQPLDSDLTYVDNLYFGDIVPQSDPKHHKKNVKQCTKPSQSADDLIGENLSFVDKQYFANESGDDSEKGSNLAFKLKKDLKNYASANTVKTSQPVSKTVKSKQTASLSESKTAYDLLMKIKQEDKANQACNAAIDTKAPYKLDSKGFRILTNQVQNLDHKLAEEIVKLLRDSVIYNENGIIAINKPYGLPVHGGPGVHHHIARYLPNLVRKIESGRGNIDQLHLVHRIDAYSTGIVLLASNQELASKLNNMFKMREIIKKYWAITIRTPIPAEGIINIPMAESKIGSRVRLTLKPIYDEQTRLCLRKNTLKTSTAITEYKVLDTSGNAALVELRPHTGVRHQIRCHLGFGLNCPILGDHKYSHITKFAPQKLPADILRNLKVRQAKARHVPMHLHAKSLIIPEINDGRNVFIDCYLPKHFVKNMNNLKLTPPFKR